MPHLVVEYTDNIDNPRMGELLRALNGVLLARGDTYPVGGIRAREIDAGKFLPCCSTAKTDLVIDA